MEGKGSEEGEGRECEGSFKPLKGKKEKATLLGVCFEGAVHRKSASSPYRCKQQLGNLHPGYAVREKFEGEKGGLATSLPKEVC